MIDTIEIAVPFAWHIFASLEVVIALLRFFG